MNFVYIVCDSGIVGSVYSTQEKARAAALDLIMTECEIEDEDEIAISGSDWEEYYGTDGYTVVIRKAPVL